MNCHPFFPILIFMFRPNMVSGLFMHNFGPMVQAQIIKPLLIIIKLISNYNRRGRFTIPF
ncbi:hypothetical protein FHS86_003367 [Roseimarinus sediminis]